MFTPKSKGGATNNTLFGKWSKFSLVVLTTDTIMDKNLKINPRIEK
jgi:hypothetical protein